MAKYKIFRAEVGWGARAYLQEVWGYDTLEEVDPLTWDCIQEYADKGYLLDNVLIRAKRSLESNKGGLLDGN
ncbi:hypothetical protein LCGC14_1586870 [marine sediment metagenome]|uniref:Uncharacterized protein n=1 Tax=marine sediment metagenome TaxID=412755 RepID=A0A0F9IF58_9ZZZZ